MRAAGGALSGHERSHVIALVVQQRELQAVGAPQPEGDARAPLRTLAYGREDLVHRCPGDGRLLHLQPLGDSERHRRADQQRKGDEERGVAPHGTRILGRSAGALVADPAVPAEPHEQCRRSGRERNHDDDAGAGDVEQLDAGQAEDACQQEAERPLGDGER